MTLSQKIAAAVDSDAGRDDEIETTYRVEDDKSRLTLSVLRASAIGIESNRLEFVAMKTPAPLRAADLKAWADRIAARVTYLMEPLVVLELDEKEFQVELRSKTPTPRDGRRSYYELVLSCDGSAVLERVAFKEADRKRETVPFQLTREVLERLVNDLVACST